MAKKFRTWRDIGSGRVRSKIKNRLIDSMGGEEGTRAFEQGPRYFKEREAQQQQQQTPTYMQQPQQPQPQPGSLTYQVNPATGLTSKVTIPSATLAQVKAGQANWTDMLVADRKSILNNPTFYQQNQITKYTPAVQQQMLADPSFQWDQLPKVKVAGFDTNINLQKIYYEGSSNPLIAGGVQGAIMGASNPLGGAVTGAVIGAVGGWAGYDQNKEAWQQGDGKLTWNVQQIKDLGKGTLGYMNLLAEWAEKTIGSAAQVANAAVDPNKEVADYLNKDAWNANVSFGETFAPAYKAAIDSERGRLGIEDIAKLAPGIYTVGALTELIRNPEKYKGEEIILGAALPVELKQSWTERLDQARKEVAAGRNYREVATEMQNGIMAQLGDMAVQGIADPLNIVGETQTAVGKKVAQISGNKVAAEAFTNTNGLREAAVKFKTLATTETLAKNIDPNFSLKNMNWLERAVAGTTKEGGIRTGSLIPTEKGLLDPIQPTDLNPMNPSEAIKAAVTRPLDFVKYMTEQDPKSRAQAGLTMFSRNIGSLVSIFKDPTELLNFVTRLSKGDNAVWAEMGGRIGGSAEWYTVLPAVKSFVTDKLQAIATAWTEITPTNREALNRVSELVGRSPTDLIDDWAKRNTHTQDFETIKAKAAASDSPAAKALLAEIEAGRFTAATLQEIVDLFSGPGALPHTEAQWKYAMYADLVDHFSGWAADHMLVNQAPEARSIFFQTVNILKQAQSIALLGMSPGYAIQNGVSGIAHLMFTGIYGGQTPKQMTDWSKRWDQAIPRLDEGVGIGGIVDTNGMDAISKAAMPEDGPLTNIRRTLSKVSRGMPMSKLSSQFESTNSKRGYVTGIQQFFSRTWRRGVGFRKMDGALIQVLKDAGINPDHIYAAYEAGVNRAEIENALSGNYKGVKVNSLVHEAAQAAGMTAAEAADTMNRIGLTDLLDKYLKGATTQDQVDAAFIRAEKKFQDWTDMRMADDLKVRAAEIANRVGKEGATAGLDIAQRVSGDFYEAYFKHYEIFGDVMGSLGALDWEQAGKAIEQAYKQSDINFRRVFENMSISYKGIFDAWSVSGDPEALRALQAISDMNTSMKEAYDIMRQARREMNRTAIAQKRKPTDAEWSNTKKVTDAAFDAAFKAKASAEIRMGEALKEIYTKRYGEEAGNAAFLWWRDVSKFGEKISKDEKRFRKSLDDARAMGADAETIRDAKKKYYSENKQQFIADLEDINAKGIARLERKVKGQAEPAAPTGIDTLTKDAQKALNNLDEGEAMPAFIDKNLKKIAEQNGIQVTIDMTAAQLIEALRYKAAEADPSPEGQARKERMDEDRAEAQRAREEVVAAANEAKQREAAVWDVAEQYYGRSGRYKRDIMGYGQGKEALLQALRKESYGGIPGARLDDPRFTPEKVKEILDARKAIKDAEAAKAEPPSVKELKKQNKKRKKGGSNYDILDAIKELGGLNINEYKGLSDGKAYGGVFAQPAWNKGRNMDDIAIGLVERGFTIDLNNPDDNGGINQLEGMVKDALAGQKIYPMDHNYDADVDQIAKQQAAYYEAQAADGEYWAAQEAPFDGDTWRQELEQAITNKNTDAIDDLLGRLPADQDQTYSEAISDAYDKVNAAVEMDAQAEAMARAKTDADEAIKSAEVHADAVMTRTILEEKFSQIFGAKKAQTFMLMEDAVSEYYARETGESPDNFWANYYRDVKRMAIMDYEDVMADLRQMTENKYAVGAGIEERVKTDQDIENMARMVARSEAAASDAIRYEPNKADRIRLIDALHKINPTMAERIARAHLGALQQEATRQVWYSKLIQTVEGIKAEKMTVQQLRGMLKGEKPDEIKWMGLETLLEGKTNITKTEVLEHLAANQIEIGEVLLSDTVKRNLDTAKQDPRWGSRVQSLDRLGFGYGLDKETNNLYFYNKNRPNRWLDAADLDNAEAENLAISIDQIYSRTMNKSTKYRDYVLPGGENYREVLFTLPSKQTGWIVTDKNNMVIERTDMKPTQEAIKKVHELGYLVLPARAETTYQSSHWKNTPNVLAHTRLTDRIDADGKRVLFVEEVQSDWHQAGREKGYSGDIKPTHTVVKEEGVWLVKNEEGQAVNFALTQAEAQSWADQHSSLLIGAVPDAPFKKTWHEMVMKRVLRMAAEEGYDRVAWTTGEQQAARYNLAYQVDYISSIRWDDNTYDIAGFKDGQRIVTENGMKEADLSGAVGKELAQKIIASEGGGQEVQWRGDDLKVGGYGMAGFYDKMLPAYMDKYAKQWGAKTGETRLASYNKTQRFNTTDAHITVEFLEDVDEWVAFENNKEMHNQGGSMLSGATPEEAARLAGTELMRTANEMQTSVHSIDVTDSMRESVMNGQSLFQQTEPPAIPDGPKLIKSFPKGAVTFDTDRIKATIYAFESADFSTLVHENAHIFRRVLKDIAERTGNAQVKADLATIEEWAGVKNGNWTVEHEEKFARGFENYVATGEAPTPKLKEAFKAFKTWMLEIYKTITGSSIDVKITPEVKAVFDRMLGAEQMEPEPKPRTKSDTPYKENLNAIKQQQAGGPAKQTTNALAPQNDLFVKREGKIYQVASFDDARNKWIEIRDISNAGVSEIGNGLKLVDSNGNNVGSISYNGRMWDAAGNEILQPGMSAADELLQRAETAGANGNEQEAAKLWTTMKERSPYFKNWFGDWEVKSKQPGAENYGTDNGLRATDNSFDGGGIGKRTDKKGSGENSGATGRGVYKIITESRYRSGQEGGSKAPNIVRGIGVVASEGKPAILYHGTKDIIDTFDPYHHNRKDFGWMGRGVYLTDDWNTGLTYAEYLKQGTGDPVVMSLYAAIKNPYIADPIKLKENLMFKSQVFIDEFTDALKQDGYDGVVGIYSNGTRELVAFYPEQVKSVNNRGTFDPNNPNILLQTAEPANLTGELPNGTVEEASQQMPVGAAMAEGFNDHVRPLMDALKQAAKNQINNKPLDGATRDLTPEGQAMLNKYQKQVLADLAGTKNAATKWGEAQRDFAMLDYNKRYGIDRYIDAIFPYQFFYTRSLATWAARALDKPALFSHYARIQRQQDRYERDIPERLRGKIKIPMPWMPEWMGDGLYIDPMKAIFTPLNYLRPFERLVADNTQQELEAERILQEWASDQSVPEQDIATAAKTRTGTTWDRALAEAKIRRESEISSPVDFMSSMLGPAWYLTTPAKLLGIKNFPGSKGGKETINSTPILNTLRAADTITQGTWAEPFGDMLGALGKPEELLRQKLNLPEFGEYGDYYVDRQLANMVADGKISSDEAQIAMIERTGANFELARERVKYELAMRVPGASALMAGLTAETFTQGVGRLAATAPASMFGAGMLPAGELEYRGLKQEWNEAWKKADAGDNKAITNFFDEHPEYEAYLSKGKDPETRLRSYLVGQIWDGYMALGTTDRKTATAEMGDSFQRDFLSTETRSLESLDVDQLARWAQMLQQSVPTTQATAGALAQPSDPVNLYDPRITQVTDKYFNDRKALFPTYYEEQAAYYNIPQADKSARLAYLSAHPKLKDYWTWNRAYKDKYPELEPIFTGKVFKDVDTSAWPPALTDYVQVYAMTGDRLPKGAWKALEQVWMAEGAPMGDMQSWLDNEVAPSILYGGGQ